MEVVGAPDTPPAHDNAEIAPDDAGRAAALSNMKVTDIISGMKRRGGAKPMPSSVQRAEERRKRRRRLAAGLPAEDAPPQRSTRVATPPPADEDANSGDDADDVVAPQMTIDENGNIVIDQASLVVTATAATSNDNDQRDVTTIENHEYTNHVTSASYAKRESATKWEEGETDNFYTALRKYGTDFSLMQSAFPKRSRRQLKLKFKREEKEFPERIDAALNGPKLPLPPLSASVDKPTDGNGESGAVVLEDDRQGDDERSAAAEGVAGESGEEQIEKEPRIVVEDASQLPRGTTEDDSGKEDEVGEKDAGVSDADDSDRDSDSDNCSDG